MSLETGIRKAMPAPTRKTPMANLAGLLGSLPTAFSFTQPQAKSGANKKIKKLLTLWYQVEGKLKPIIWVFTCLSANKFSVDPACS